MPSKLPSSVRSNVRSNERGDSSTGEAPRLQKGEGGLLLLSTSVRAHFGNTDDGWKPVATGILCYFVEIVVRIKILCSERCSMQRTLFCAAKVIPYAAHPRKISTRA